MAQLKRMTGAALLNWISALYTYTADIQEEVDAQRMRDRSYKYYGEIAHLAG
jgi:hypothetical protein